MRQVKERAEADHKHSSSLEIELTENNQKLEAQVSSLEEELSLKKAALEAEQSRYTSLEAEFSHNMGHMKGERDRCSSLERELSQTEKAANNLQAELGISQQRLEEALDLCSQHEILIEQRNGELDSLEEKLRCVLSVPSISTCTHMQYSTALSINSWLSSLPSTPQVLKFKLVTLL